jgi:hypothetical protein
VELPWSHACPESNSGSSCRSAESHARLRPAVAFVASTGPLL